MTRVLPLTLLLCLLAVPRVALAQATGNRPLAEAIRVDPPDTACLTHDALTGRVARWLGKPDIDAAIGVDVDVEATAEGTQATFVMRRDGEPSAERSFDVLPRDCGARIAAVSLAIALAIDHTVLERISTEELQALSSGTAAGGTDAGETAASAEDDTVDAPAAQREGTANEETDGDAEPDEAPSGGRRTYGPGTGPDVSLAVGGFISAGVVPNIAPGARAELGLRFGGTWSLRLSGLLAAETEADLGQGAVAADLVAGAIHTCAGMPVGRVRLDGCGGLGAGAYAARGEGFQTPQETTREWLGAMAATELAFPVISRLALRLRAELLVPLIRPRLQVVDPTGATLAEESISAVGGFLGLEAVYPMP